MHSKRVTIRIPASTTVRMNYLTQPPCAHLRQEWIYVRNDADIETPVNATIQRVHTQVGGKQNGNNALLGEV